MTTQIGMLLGFLWGVYLLSLCIPAGRGLSLAQWVVGLAVASFLAWFLFGLILRILRVFKQ